MEPVMDDDKTQVRKLYEALIAGWNQRDAAAMAGLFAPRGSQVGFDGSPFNTPQEIAAALGPIFKDHPTARFVTIVREVRPIAEGAMILRAVAGMIPPGDTAIKPERNVIQSVVASRTSSAGWKIEMFQNTPAEFHGRPEEVEALTTELQAVADRANSGLQR